MGINDAASGYQYYSNWFTATNTSRQVIGYNTCVRLDSVHVGRRTMRISVAVTQSCSTGLVSNSRADGRPSSVLKARRYGSRTTTQFTV